MLSDFPKGELTIKRGHSPSLDKQGWAAAFLQAGVSQSLRKGRVSAPRKVLSQGLCVLCLEVRTVKLIARAKRTIRRHTRKTGKQSRERG